MLASVVAKSLSRSIVAPGGSSRIRVLRVFSRLNIGGPSVHVVLLTSGLRERGYETRLVVGQEAPREGNLFGFAEERDVQCERMSGLGREIRPLSDLRALWGLYRMIREYAPDIVHTHTAKAGVLGRVAARLAGAPVVVHTYHGHVLHGYFPAWKTALFRWLERGLARSCNVLLAVSDSVKEELVAYGIAPSAKIRVVPLGLELDALAGALPRGRLRHEAGFAADAPLVGAVGRLVPIKDIGTFLAAAARVAEARPEVRFSLVGDGEQRAALEAEAGRLGLGGRVHFHGWHRDMAAVYGDLDLVVNCSRNEGTPVALIEALAAARPVVATAVGGTPDLLERGAFGRLVPAGEPAELARAILESLGSAEARERARRGQGEIVRRYSVVRLIDDMDRLYGSLLTARQAA